MNGKHNEGAGSDAAGSAAGENLEARRLALAQQLSGKKAEQEKKTPENLQKVKNYNQSTLGMGVRLSTDFLSAVLVGGALGLGIDKLTGYVPWGLLIFLSLGFIAGIINILRALGRPVPYEKNKVKK